MKSPGDDNEFNSPKEMLNRATFLVCLAAFTAGILLVVIGTVAGDLRLAGWGAALLIIAGVTRGWLRRHGKFEEMDGALHGFAETGSPTHPERVAELVRLLREWEALERKRGSPGFDPWALQSVRHDIRVIVDADPALDGLFHDGRRAA